MTLVYDFIVDVWEKSHCHNCYNATERNGTTVYNATDETKEMLEVSLCGAVEAGWSDSISPSASQMCVLLSNGRMSLGFIESVEFVNS